MSSVNNDDADNVDNNFDMRDDIGEEEATTQLSQDLLLASPATAKLNNCSRSNKPLQYDESDKKKQFSPSKDNRTSSVSPLKVAEEGYAKKPLPSCQKNSVTEMAVWIYSARHTLHGGEDKQTTRHVCSCLCSSPYRKG